MIQARILTWLALEPSERNKTLILSGTVIALLIAAYILLVAVGSSYTEIWLIDVFGLVNAAYRIYLGQLPSIDFHSGLAIGVYYPAALGFAVGLGPSSVLAFGQVLIGAVLLPPAIVIARSRLDLVSASIFLIFVALIIIAPMGLGGSPSETSFGVFYNRHGWAALSILLLCYVEPRSIRRAIFWQDVAAISVILLFLFATLINFAVVAVAFMAANAVVSKYDRQLSVICLALLVGVLATVEVLTGYVSAYMADLQTLIGGKSSALGGLANLRAAVGLASQVWLSITTTTMAYVAMLVAGRRRLLDLAFLLGALVVTAALGVQTESGSVGVPALVAVIVCFGELVRRATQSQLRSADRQPQQLGGAALVIAGFLVLFVSKPLIERTYSIAHYHTRAVQEAVLPGQDDLPALAGFRVAKDDLPDLHKMLGHTDERHALLAKLRHGLRDQLTSAAYMSTIVEGALLLEPYVDSCQSIVVFDAVDPFTIALSLKPTHHGYPLFWAGAAFSKESHPAPELFFSDASFAMVPVVPQTQRQLESMLEIYGTYLGIHFEEAARSRHWRLWRRSATLEDGCDPVPGQSARTALQDEPG